MQKRQAILVYKIRLFNIKSEIRENTGPAAYIYIYIYIYILWLRGTVFPRDLYICLGDVF
jgi:hypothetical protein